MTPQQLFTACDHVVSAQPYPLGTQQLGGGYPVAGRGFFPVVSGSFHTCTLHLPLQPRRLMFVGQDWGSVANLSALVSDPNADIKSGTGKHLHDLLVRAKIPLDDCFFTNALFSVRTGTTNTGPSPGWSDPAFVRRCEAALVLQIQAIKPRAIVSLGRQAPKLLERIFSPYPLWNTAATIRAIDASGDGLISLPNPILGVQTLAFLVHPCHRAANVKHRTFRNQTGDAAEILILQSC